MIQAWRPPTNLTKRATLRRACVSGRSLMDSDHLVGPAARRTTASFRPNPVVEGSMTLARASLCRRDYMSVYIAGAPARWRWSG